MITSIDGSNIWTVVVAAGTASRFGAPKQFQDLAGERVVDRSVSVAAAHSTGVVVVLPSALVANGRHDVTSLGRGCVIVVVAGADTRAGSVRAGLAVVPAEANVILVHDGARPLATDEIYERLIAAISGGADAAVPVVPLVDTIRRRSGGVVDRSELVAVQTPQAFRAEALRSAHASGADATDDSALVEQAGGVVVLVDGESDNLKITEPSDLEFARQVLARRRDIT